MNPHHIVRASIRPLALAVSIGVVLSACSPSTGDSGSAATTNPPPRAGPGAPSGLAYDVGRPVYRAGRAIATNTAQVSGSNITFAVQPALPGGLVLDTASGSISGTPTTSTGTSTHTVTATNANGADATMLRITVLPFGSALDDAQFGQAGTVRLLSVVWGRLVDVYDQDSAGSTRLVARDLLVRADLQPTSMYEVQTNAVTQVTRITIAAPLGTSSFTNAFDALETNLPALAPIGPGTFPTYPMVPRNATIALLFDDLLDPATLSNETLRVSTGTAGTGTQLPRLRADPNHGNAADRDGDGQLEFWSTRVLVDPAVSELEAFESAAVIPVDLDGFPASESSFGYTVLLRIPTVTDAGVGQLTLLRNLVGTPISNTESGPILPTTPTIDVVRALRSGGPSALTGDPFEGFLYDVEPPHIVAQVPVIVSGVQADALGNAEDRRVDVQFADIACASALQRGDALQIGRSVLEVLETSSAPVGATVSGVRVKILRRTQSLVGSGRWTARLDAGSSLPPACFLAFDPSSSANAVDPSARVILRSDEPLDRSSLSGMDSTRIARVATGSGGREIVPAYYNVPADLGGVTLQPLVPLTHASGSAETYHVRIAGWRDLAGNTLALELPDAPFVLDPAAASVTSGGVTFTFDSNDMLPGPGAPPDAGSTMPEFRGQYLLDLASGTVQGRPVSRFQAAADRTQTVPSIMIPFTPGVQTPISRFGSKLQTVWRYCDVGFGLLDEQFHNVDVEHLYWSPVGGGVIADTISRFEIGLAHSARLPDEAVDAFAAPLYPSSGLVATFAQNVADPVNDPLRTVHPGASGIAGYQVQPIDASLTAGGTPIMPWPLNRGLPLDRFERTTWRDTALQVTAAPNGTGAELGIVNQTSGTGTAGQPYAAGSVPSIGLPLLMEFRCYPDNNTLGLNSFDVSLANAVSPRPNFRAFSTGGISTSGVVLRDPDLQTVATGGFNPNSTPSPGAATPPLDNAFYIGAMDLVVRVSRSHTIWIDAGAATTEWATTAEFSGAEQPAGTEVVFAFRGASSIANGALTTDAGMLDPYGDATSGAQPTFFQSDASWKSDAGVLSGSRYLQARVSFVANAATNATPKMSAFGIAWK